MPNMISLGEGPCDDATLLGVFRQAAPPVRVVMGVSADGIGS